MTSSSRHGMCSTRKRDYLSSVSAIRNRPASKTSAVSPDRDYQLRNHQHEGCEYKSQDRHREESKEKTFSEHLPKVETKSVRFQDKVVKDQGDKTFQKQDDERFSEMINKKEIKWQMERKFMLDENNESSVDSSIKDTSTGAITRESILHAIRKNSIEHNTKGIHPNVSVIGMKESKDLPLHNLEVDKSQVLSCDEFLNDQANKTAVPTPLVVDVPGISVKMCSTSHTMEQHESLGKLIHDLATPMHNIFNILSEKVGNLEVEYHSLKQHCQNIQQENKTIKQRAEDTEVKVREIEETQREMKQMMLNQYAHCHGDEELEQRWRRLLVVGLSETENLTYNNITATDDTEKVSLLMQVMGMEQIQVLLHRRVGKPDQSAEKRPKFLLLDFPDKEKRNKVKRAAHKLRQVSQLSHIRLKAVLTKEEREEYTKVFKIRDQMVKEQPDRKVEFSKRTLYVDGKPVYSIKGPYKYDEDSHNRTLT